MSYDIKSLKDKSANTIYPQTLTTAVYDNNNNSLNQLLSQCVSVGIISAYESSSVSAHAYEVGSYLVCNNTLYKVTAAISIGDTITPNVNVTSTTITDEIIDNSTQDVVYMEEGEGQSGSYSNPILYQNDLKYLVENSSDFTEFKSLVAAL